MRPWKAPQKSRRGLLDEIFMKPQHSLKKKSLFSGSLRHLFVWIPIIAVMVPVLVPTQIPADMSDQEARLARLAQQRGSVHEQPDIPVELVFAPALQTYQRRLKTDPGTLA